MWSAVGRLWGHLDRFPLRRLVVAEERPGTLGGGLDVVAVRGEAAPTEAPLFLGWGGGA